jgi:hypothetical protein
MTATAYVTCMRKVSYARLSHTQTHVCTSVVMSPALPTAHERCGKMGTLGKDGSNPLIFDGRPESWPPFKKALHQLLDKEGYDWVVEGGDVFCAMLKQQVPRRPRAP